MGYQGNYIFDMNIHNIPSSKQKHNLWTSIWISWFFRHRITVNFPVYTPGRYWNSQHSAAPERGDKNILGCGKINNVNSRLSSRNIQPLSCYSLLFCGISFRITPPFMFLFEDMSLIIVPVICAWAYAISAQRIRGTAPNEEM